MFVLKLLFLFSLQNSIFSLNNNTHDNNYLHSIRIIQNTPVENNIPLIIQEIDKNYIDQNAVNQNPINSPILIPNGQNINEVITNTSIKINTTNMDPMCTKECCMGCQIQFLKLTSQKNCIINICKCQIIEINHEKINIIQDNTNITNENAFMFVNMINKDLNINDINEINSEYSFYWFILVLFFCYEIYIVYNFNRKDNKFNCNKDIVNNNLGIEKEKEKRISDYMELLYGDEELIESLI